MQNLVPLALRPRFGEHPLILCLANFLYTNDHWWYFCQTWCDCRNWWVLLDQCTTWWPWLWCYALVKIHLFCIKLSLAVYTIQLTIIRIECLLWPRHIPMGCQTLGNMIKKRTEVLSKLQTYIENIVCLNISNLYPFVNNNNWIPKQIRVYVNLV